MTFLAERFLSSPVGMLRVRTDALGVTAVDRVRSAPRVKPRIAISRLGVTLQDEQRATRHAEQAACELHEYFSGARTSFNVPLHLVGTKFQQRAWAEMQKIPFGSTISYGTQAKRMKNPRAVRAVGSANGANPIPIIVPCHRVVAADGSLGGYALGLAMKRTLLALEHAD